MFKAIVSICIMVFIGIVMLIVMENAREADSKGNDDASKAWTVVAWMIVLVILIVFGKYF